jgi:hypothetical protein
LDEFLRRRFAAAVAALLRHRAANPFCFRGIWSVDPQLGRAVSHSQTFGDRTARFAGRGFIANIDVAIAHDCYPLLESDHNAELPRKVAQRSLESVDQALRFTIIGLPKGFSTRQRLKSRAGIKPAGPGVPFSDV